MPGSHIERTDAPAHAAVAFRVHVLLALVLGAWLRLYDFGAQLMVSDEWHGPHAALNASYGELVSLLTLGATSVPSNVYYALLLDTVGWSEWTLRLPSLVAGIALVALAPWLLRRSIGERAACVTGYLLAVSPLLVMYSRYARPYSPVVLLTLVAFLACRRWAATGRHRAAVVFASTAVLAGYLHLLEARSLAIPLAFMVCAKLLDRRVPALATVPSLRAIVVTGIASCGALALLLLPAILSPNERFFGILEEDRPTLVTLSDSFALLAGTGRRVALGVLLPLALGGAVRLVARDAWLAALFGAVTAGCVASVWIAHPVDSDVAIVFARYTIPLLPIGAVLVACGADAVLAWVGARLVRARPAMSTGVLVAGRSLAGAALVIGLLLAGPLPGLYSGPNAFGNHKAFHVAYSAPGSERERFDRFLEHMKWRGPRANVAVSDFYVQLAQDPEPLTLIEYPVPIGDLFSPGFIHQRVHGKRVLAGWLPRPAAEGERVDPGVVYANWTPDEVLAGAQAERLHFRTLVELTDQEAVRRSGARYLVLHRNLGAETLGSADAEPFRPPVCRYFDATYGSPVFEDEWILVYDLRAR